MKQDGILTLHDPNGNVSDAEEKEVLKQGYMHVVGGITWPVMNCFSELVYGISNAGTVASRPSEKAWLYVMHILAWLRDHKDQGLW